MNKLIIKSEVNMNQIKQAQEKEMSLGCIYRGKAGDCYSRLRHIFRYGFQKDMRVGELLVGLEYFD